MLQFKYEQPRGGKAVRRAQETEATDATGLTLQPEDVDWASFLPQWLE